MCGESGMTLTGKITGTIHVFVKIRLIKVHKVSCHKYNFPITPDPYEAQDTATPRWTIGEHSTTAEKKKQKRVTIVHLYHV